MHDHVHHAVGLKIAEADGFDLTRAIKLLHRAPCAVNVAVRLVDQVEVEHVEPLRAVAAGLERGADHARLGVFGEVVDALGHVDVGLVAGGHEVREAQPARLRQPNESRAAFEIGAFDYEDLLPMVYLELTPEQQIVLRIALSMKRWARCEMRLLRTWSAS